MEQEKSIKCIKCHKDISMQEGVKTSKGVVCESCQKKGKVKQGLIALTVLLLLAAGGYAYYLYSQKNNTIGFNGAADIQDSIQVVTENPEEIFKLEATIAQSNHGVVGQTIDNIESFKELLRKTSKRQSKIKHQALLSLISMFYLI